MNPHPATSSGYWYAGDAARHPALEVLEALRTYRAAETAMRIRTRDSMGMGEKDLLALRYLLEADRAGAPLGPRDLADRLGISSASITTLLDRLTRKGHVVRRPHPTDRRALVIVATEEAHCEIRSTLGSMHQRMMSVAGGLSPEEAATVTRFLHAMVEAIGATDDDGHTGPAEQVEDRGHLGPGAA